MTDDTETGAKGCRSLFMCERILLITCLSSTHAMILTEPWQCLQTVISMLNTRFSLIAQLIFLGPASQSEDWIFKLSALPNRWINVTAPVFAVDNLSVSAEPGAKVDLQNLSMESVQANCST